MSTKSRNSVVTRVGLRAVFVPRVRSVVPLVILSFAILTASAQAHTVSATATCRSVTFHWTAFASSGYGNNGHNTPGWKVVFTPNGGATTTQSGNVSFDGSSFTLTVPIGGGNGTVTASSAWRPDQTRDGHSASWSRQLTISNCPVVVSSPPPPRPPVPPVPPAPPATPATPALSTTASADVALGGSIHDTAVLSGGSSPTGTITFNLYAANDTTCSTALSTVAVPVSGAGNYDSPAVTPASGGSYQWVATYSGDAANHAVANACNDPNEQSNVAVTIVEASCVPSPVVLRGVSAKVRRALTVHVTALGVKSVTFYLDGRKVATVTKPTNHRYAVKINARKLGYGRHRLTARATMRDAACARAAAAGSFVKVKPPRIPRSSPASGREELNMPRHDGHVVHALALGLGIGALILGSGADAAGAASPASAPAASAPPGETVLSNGRTISRWAYPQAGAIVRRSPSRAARAVGRLHFLTEDGQAEIYVALAQTIVAETGVTWIEVSVPKRPNHVTGWVAASALGTLHVVRGRLVVRRSKLRATLYNGAGHAIFSAPVGIGRSSLATPAGQFYVREKLRAIGSPMYGPFALGTSAYAPKLTDWPGGGVVGIHGTDQPQLIPGRPSHGCIRLRNADITRLWHLMSVGMPVDII